VDPFNKPLGVHGSLGVPWTFRGPWNPCWEALL